MTVTEKLNRIYLRKLVSTPAGRAHVLAQTADGESSGEARIFTEVLAHAADPELGRMVSRHRDDELRHERLFRERLAATGVGEPELPDELRFVEQLNRALGGILDRPIRDARGVLEAYCLLQVLEERAVQSFGMFIDAFSVSDPPTAKVFAEVLEDERRHLKYCAAVAKRYAISDDERLQVLARTREVEARVFQENQQRNMEHTLSRGFMGGQTFAWRLLQRALRVVRLAGVDPAAAPLPA